MRIFVAGVSCVGKITIGARLASLLEYRFFDLDVETERFFGTSIERLRNRHLTSNDFRLVASQALKDVLSRRDSCNCVIALPPTIVAEWPTTVTKSRCPRALVRRTQKPFSALWKVTRSTRPARASWVAMPWLASCENLRIAPVVLCRRVGVGNVAAEPVITPLPSPA